MRHRGAQVTINRLSAPDSKMKMQEDRNVVGDGVSPAGRSLRVCWVGMFTEAAAFVPRGITIQLGFVVNRARTGNTFTNRRASLPVVQGSAIGQVCAPKKKPTTRCRHLDPEPRHPG